MDSENRVLTKQEKIAQNAKRLPEVSFTSLSHHMDRDWMLEAYNRTRKNGAAGVDGETAGEYQKELMSHLDRLLEKLKSGSYKAPPVRRVYIPKGTGKEKRPIGIPTFEDKIAQRAISMLLEPVYEQDFYDFSYGFRPGKSGHKAIKVLRKRMVYQMRDCYVIDMDIRKFFDTVNNAKLREILKQRISDGVITRLIGKWLKAGIMEGDQLSYQKEGTPQGGVISPLLSNIYLHEVLDKWYMEVVRPRLKCNSFLVRFADDALLVFENPEDAKKVLEVLPKRFERYGLELHPDKTKLIKFSQPKGEKKSKTSFTFLGFTFYWGLSSKKRWTIKVKTAKDRLQRALKQIWQWCKRNRHMKVRWQHMKLTQKVRGHYAYYGISFNSRSLNKFWHSVKQAWFYWLRRRGNRKSLLNWNRFENILKTFWLPRPKIYHSLFSKPVI